MSYIFKTENQTFKNFETFHPLTSNIFVKMAVLATDTDSKHELCMCVCVCARVRARPSSVQTEVFNASSAEATVVFHLKAKK